MTFTSAEIEAIHDLKARIERGEYDSDRHRDMSAPEFIVRYALPIIGYAVVVGALVYVLGIIVVGVLIDRGML